jgi:UDP-glucose 4-epimerase
LILLARTGAGAPGSPTAILLFGSGRLGSAIRESLDRAGGWKSASIPFPWDDPRGLEEAADRTIQRAAKLVGARGRVAVVWSAGACGFTATEEDAAAEAVSFGTVLAVALGIAEGSRAGSVDLHLLSSAGGLFEGRLDVGLSSTPAPQRPYGRLKLAEERCVLGAAATLRVRIYRVSSVYGPIREGRRMGLVSTLVRDCDEGRETPIFGGMDTLRDYVHADDVGAFVARAVTAPAADPSPSVVFLASGKATSIRDVLATVARVTGKQCRVRAKKGGDNDRPITFSPAALPVGWKPRELERGIRDVHEDWIASRKPKPKAAAKRPRKK